MKVYATELKNNGEMILVTWPSMKAFSQTESWADDRFINVMTKNDVLAFCSYPYYAGMVIWGDDLIASHNMLHTKYLEITA